MLLNNNSLDIMFSFIFFKILFHLPEKQKVY